MTRRQQQTALPDVPAGPRRRVWCKGHGCGRELTDETSRLRGYGEECDPEPRHTARRFDVDQEPLPGM